MASWRRPCAIRIAARVVAPLIASEMFPALCRLRHAIGIRPVRCLEIPARPEGEPQERRCRSPREMVILGCEVEHLPGICHGVRHIAQQPGPVAARCIAIDPGRRRNSSSSITTISAGVASALPFRLVVSSHRSASRRRSSTPSSSPLLSNIRAYSTLSTGLYAEASRRGAPSASQAAWLPVYSCALLVLPARSDPPLARNPCQPARGESHRLPNHSARTTHSRADADAGTWSGCSAIRCIRRTSAKRW